MKRDCPFCHRRAFLRKTALGSAALFIVPGAFAEALTPTPSMTEGPFYPDKLPLDTDNDLLLITDGITPAVGAVTHLTGSVVSASGTPINNALVEIWQVDNNGVYLHSGSDNREKWDKNFQGYGRFSTNRKGEYYFRTIQPPAYTGRTPHIHVAVTKGNKRLLTTQIFIKGHEGNAKDGLFKRLKDAQHLVAVDFTPIKESKAGELAAHFKIVLGTTPDDGAH